MSNFKVNDESDKLEFAWGEKRGRGGPKKEIQFYKSFTFDGVQYFLYDSVFLFKDGEEKPYVGKIIKIWEHKNKAKKVKILWYFFPWEISNYLSNENVLENEIFLATGDGKGLANVNSLEAIAGKCNVICISKDERNRQPSTEEIKMAQYVFYRTFDVQTYAISDKLGEKIAMIEVNFLLNKNDFKATDPSMVDSENVAVVRDAAVSTLVKDNEAAKSLSENLKCHPVESVGAAGPNNASPVVGMEKNLISENLGGLNEIVESDGSVGSLLVKDDKALKRKDDATAAEVALASSKKIRLSSPDSKQNDKNEKGAILLSNNSDKHKANGAVAKGKSDGKHLKKRKIDGAALLSDNDGSGTPKLSTVISKMDSKSVGAATEFNGLSEGLAKKLKPDGLTGEKTNGKLCEMSAKRSEDKEGSAAVSVAAIKRTQPANGAAEIYDKDTSKIVGTSNCLSQKPNSNIKIENKSTANDVMVERKSNGKNIKVEHNSNDKNIKVELQYNDKMRKVHVKDESKDAEYGACGHVIDVTQRPPDRSKWFTASPWEDRMKDARDQRRLVLLQNLDPTYAASEVEDIVWHGFKENCTAKMLQHTGISSQHSGQALIILKTQEAAAKVVMMLEKKCLMLPNGRPVIGSREVPCFPGKRSPFPGHLVIDKLRHQLQREAREAVSTSHSSQPNTIEYEMALEWRLLQDRSELWWKLMHKKQGEEIKKLKASLKSPKNQNELVVR